MAVSALDSDSHSISTSTGGSSSSSTSSFASLFPSSASSTHHLPNQHHHNRSESSESFASSVSRGEGRRDLPYSATTMSASAPSLSDAKKRKGSPSVSPQQGLHRHQNSTGAASDGSRSSDSPSGGGASIEGRSHKMSSSTSQQMKRFKAAESARAAGHGDAGVDALGGPPSFPSSPSLASWPGMVPEPDQTGRNPPREEDVNGKKRRVKTQRACDSCRRKKIRCDVIEDGGPVTGNVNNGNGGLTCAHCKQYGFECTFFLPITETRFKKKREREAEEMAAAAAAATATATNPNRVGPNTGSSHLLPSAVPFMGSSPLSASPMVQPAPSNFGPATPTSHLDSHPSRISASQEWPRRRPESSLNSTPRGWSGEQEGVTRASLVSPKSAPPIVPPKSRSGSEGAPPPADTRVLGPTSIAYIVHSTAFVPGAAIEQHDLKHHQTFEVGASGDGIIKFHKPPKGDASMTDGEDGGDGYDIAKIADSIRGRLAGDVAEKLVNSYFEKVGFLFPVMTKSEFLHLSPPPPLLLYSICGVAALSRDVPKEVLAAVKTTLNSLFRDLDLLSNSNNNTVKALLIMSLHSDLHGNTAVQGGTRSWNRVGAAIRMAQDLGLHRDASGRDDLDEDAFFLEQKRRVWGCCVTADRCMSVSLGHPLGIDLTDCDVRLPSPHEILRLPSDLPSDPSTDRPFAFNTEMLKLSILFGRVMKTVYSPTGLMKATDEEMVGLLLDIDRWKESLPAPLQFKGPRDSSAPAGILHVSYSCLLHLLFRVFMRISYNCPTHLSFSLTIERMSQLIRFTRESIEWVDLNDFYLDTLQFVSYGLVFCATVQYHAWIRRGDHLALSTLKSARDCVTRFKRQGEHDASEELSMRAKTAEVITMLHDSALGAYATGSNTGNLNPTAGVTNRRTADAVRGIVFKQDQSRPGGGVYVATNPHLVLNDLPRGTIILQDTETGRVPALVRTDEEVNGGWQPIDAGRRMETIQGVEGGEGGTGSNGQSTGSPPTAPDLTYVAGDVWTDAEGRPVNRRGSRLMTVVPLQAEAGQSNRGGQVYMTNGQPRLSFSDISGVKGTGSGGQQQQQHHLQSQSSSSVLNDAAWLNAMTNTINPGAFPNMATFNDSSYSFDGQTTIPAQAFSMNPTSGSQQDGGQNRGGNSGEDRNGRLQNVNVGISSSSAPSHSIIGGLGGSSGIQMLDPLSLDEMPGGPLDFQAWDSWFRNTGSFNVEG